MTVDSRSGRETEGLADDSAAAAFARRHGLQHQHGRHELVHRWSTYPFGVGRLRRARNVVHGSLRGRSVTAFEYHFMFISDDERNGYERDSLHRYLVCVVDLEHSVPALAAVRTEWLEWHRGQLDGDPIDVQHEAWSSRFTLLGGDLGFAAAVVKDDNAARCAQFETHVEWRFLDDELLLWVKSGRVDDELTRLIELAEPLLSAAETYEAAAES